MPRKTNKPREKKPPTVAQRVEILLREGVDPPDAWMGVPRYDRLDFVDAEGPTVADYETLYQHHLDECAFLRAVISEMREQIIALDSQLDDIVEPGARRRLGGG